MGVWRGCGGGLGQDAGLRVPSPDCTQVLGVSGPPCPSCGWGLNTVYSGTFSPFGVPDASLLYIKNWGTCFPWVSGPCTPAARRGWEGSVGGIKDWSDLTQSQIQIPPLCSFEEGMWASPILSLFVCKVGSVLVSPSLTPEWQLPGVLFPVVNFLTSHLGAVRWALLSILFAHGKTKAQRILRSAVRMR